MSFETPVVPWIDEIQNYLNDESKKPGDLKKVLKSADLESLSYADKARLYKMFDPKCQISEELLKRQLNLYFSLLESKSSPMKIPVFTDYVDWIYSQDISKMSDRTFDTLASRLLKTTTSDLSESIKNFIDKLPQAFDKPIDAMSNARISTLISIMNATEMEYSSMPEECKKFVQEMFKACSVKSEIADKNKNQIRKLFREDPKYYYNLMNKAFAGCKVHESWIDEPAKRLTIPNMINYANFQGRIISNYRKALSFEGFASYAKDLDLPKLPPYDKEELGYSRVYLQEPREYKDYAKKMGHLFTGLVREEMARVEKLFDDRKVTTEHLYDYAITQSSKSKVRLLNPYASKREFLNKYSEFMIGLVHLDELTGQSYANVYDASKIKDNNLQAKRNDERAGGYRVAEQYPIRGRKSEVDGQFSLFGNNDISYRHLENTEENTNSSEQYTVDDLPELRERYDEMLKEGIEDYDLIHTILDLEDQWQEMQEKNK